MHQDVRRHQLSHNNLDEDSSFPPLETIFIRGHEALLALHWQLQTDSAILDETPTLDGPTSDMSAGIGVEFESSDVTFAKEGCSAADKQVADRKDKDNN